MCNARSWKITAVLCALVGLVSVALATALAHGDDGPRPTNSGSPYQLVTAVNAAGDSWFANRINKTTGDAWSTIGTAWTKMGESGKLPSGDYDLQIIPIGSGNNASAQVLRIERKTGQTWTYSTGTWTPVAESK